MTTAKDAGQPQTLLDWLCRRRDEERAGRGRMTVVRLDDTVLEDNDNGRMRWYLHPALPDRCIRSTIVFRHELPPGASTGVQRIQGSQVLYVVSGNGRSLVNGVSHHWEAGDVIAIPVLPNGAIVQHTNDSEVTALLVAAEPNWMDVFGVDMGSGFEQLEPRPEEGY